MNSDRMKRQWIISSWSQSLLSLHSVWVHLYCLHYLYLHLPSLSSIILLIEEVHSAIICNDRIQEDRDNNRINDWDEDNRDNRDNRDNEDRETIETMKIHDLLILGSSQSLCLFYLSSLNYHLILLIEEVHSAMLCNDMIRRSNNWDEPRDREIERQWRQWMRDREIEMNSEMIHCLSLSLIISHYLSVFIISLSSLSHCLSLSSLSSLSLSYLILLIEEVHSAMLYNERIEKTIDTMKTENIELSSSLNWSQFNVLSVFIS